MLNAQLFHVVTHHVHSDYCFLRNDHVCHWSWVSEIEANRISNDMCFFLKPFTSSEGTTYLFDSLVSSSEAAIPSIETFGGSRNHLLAMRYKEKLLFCKCFFWGNRNYIIISLNK